MSCVAEASGEGKSIAMVTSSGYCYSDGAAAAATSGGTPAHMVASHLQGFEHNHPEIYNLTTHGMEMIGFPLKNHHTETTSSSSLWKGFFNKPNHGGPSSSKSINESSGNEYYQHGISTDGGATAALSESCWHEQQRLLVEDDDPSLRCVFPCEGNEKPSQGLSLSLRSSSNPSSIGFQSFELRQNHHGINGFSMNIQNQQEQIMQDGFLGKAEASNFHFQGQFLIRNSKYLAPAQELLSEFCNLGIKQIDHSSKKKLQNTNQCQEENSKKQSFPSLDLLELQKRKTRLLQLLEEVDRRYKHYCDQMKAVISTFEAMAGNGSAKVYSALASKAMSKHFRCLRDAIVEQLKNTKKAMGEKDIVAPGTTKGETPRLRILDQTLRQQRAFQQMTMMETHPWRPQRGLPERSVSVLRAWLFEHFLHPYPSDVDKHILARQTGLSRSQVSNWFINARVRLWKPMVEEMYLEELKDQENADSIDGGHAATATDDHDNVSKQNQNEDDQKPTHDQLVRIDSECLSSIINNNQEINNGQNGKTFQQPQQQHNVFCRSTDSLGVTELDFSSYNHNFANENAAHDNYGRGGGVGGSGSNGGGGSGNGNGGVSLTLGLQQHGGGGVTLAFSQASQSASLFYSPRDHIEDCQQVQYSLLDNEGQNLPYRNLMGAQLLHDLAG